MLSNGCGMINRIGNFADILIAVSPPRNSRLIVPQIEGMLQYAGNRQEGTRRNKEKMLDHYHRHYRRTYAGRMVPRLRAFPRLLRRPKKRTGFAFLPILTRLMAVLFVLTTVFSIATGFAIHGAYQEVASLLKPRLAELETRHVFETSRIFDRHGQLLYEFFGSGKRTRVSLDHISPLIIHATIAIEDKTFFINPGVDYEGMIRALYQNLTAGDEVSGASTITQQVVKYIILKSDELAHERRYERKLKEIILAQELSRRYSKEHILEIYLNEIYYGNLAYGVEAASNVYFGVHAKDLTLNQASLLAGLPQLPSRYDPIAFLRRDEKGYFLPGVPVEEGWLSPEYELPDTIPPPRRRQIAVLRQMVDEGYITEAEATQAIRTDLRFAPQDTPLHAPHFVFYVRKLLEEKYGQRMVNEGGLNIYTTLDLHLQRLAQAEATRHIESIKSRNIHNASVVVMQPRTGQILAMVGSVDYHAVVPTSQPGEQGNVLDGQVNVAIRERQPGSSLKPFTYLAAMERGMTPASILWDVPTEFPTGDGWYRPRNYNGRWNGPVRIRTALANSLNMPAVKALKYAGIDYTLKLLDRVGIKHGLKRGADHYGLSLTLGGGEVTLLELTTAYNTLASNGQYYPPTAILKITDSSGQVLESYKPRSGQQVVEPALNSIIVDMLSDDNARAAIWGRNSKLKLSQPAAVKTGTSEDWRDAWTIGFTPYITIGVWSGNNNNEPTHEVESLAGGGIIWHNLMEKIFQQIGVSPLSDPGLTYQEQLHRILLEPYPDGKLPQTFPSPESYGAERRSICPLPGPFGGYDREWFTPKMLYGSDAAIADATTPLPAGQAVRRTPTITGTASDLGGRSQRTATARSPGYIEGACDAFRSVLVVRVNTPSGGTRFCRPVSGQSYPPELTQYMTIWNVPDPEPGIRVSYGGWPTRQTYFALPECTPSMFARPEPTPESKPQPPIPGAIQMPDLRMQGESQALAILKQLGVHDVIVDHQGRGRIPDQFDAYPAYTVLSTLPQAGNWIYPGTAVVLGVRGPDDGQSPPPTAHPIPTPTHTPIPPEQPVLAPPDAPTPLEQPVPAPTSIPVPPQPPPAPPAEVPVEEPPIMPPPTQPEELPTPPPDGPPPTATDQ